MADSTEAPVDAKVEAAQAKQEAENARWEGDFKPEELDIPYKRAEEEKEEPPKEPEEEGEEGEDDEEQGVDTGPAEAVLPPEPVITAEDPGTYEPADYSFEVTLKDGKTVKVGSPEEADKLADDPDNFETPKQLMDFINKQNKMQRSLDKDYEKWEAEKQQYDAQVEEQQNREETVNNLTKGFEYLIAKGLMPKLDPADAVADWADPEVAKHPGVKEQIDLINYMVKENESRQKAGIPLLGSALDAFNAWQLETGRNKAVQEKKQAGEERKAAGARVAGVSASQQGSYVPKGIAVGNPHVLKRGASVWDD